jgi:hypothetical protein
MDQNFFELKCCARSTDNWFSAFSLTRVEQAAGRWRRSLDGYQRYD